MMARRLEELERMGRSQHRQKKGGKGGRMKKEQIRGGGKVKPREVEMRERGETWGEKR